MPTEDVMSYRLPHNFPPVFDIQPIAYKALFGYQNDDLNQA